MTEDELRAGMIRELISNIIAAPAVLLIRLPLGLIYASLDAITSGLDRANRVLPGWRIDYFKAWRRSRRP
jgi:hypothetical protein